MAYTKIINITYDLADELKTTETYQQMQKLDKIIKTKYKEELENYQQTFKKFDEVFSTGGVYHPDYENVSKPYLEAKKTLFTKEEVKLYFQNERKINKVLKEISDNIRKNITNYKGGILSENK